MTSVPMPVDLAGPSLEQLGPGDAGEILTLQRAAYITEAQAHGDLSLPPLTQSLAELRTELARESVTAWGLRVSGRLVAAVRVHVDGSVAHLGRLVVAPDSQGRGLGSWLLLAAEQRCPTGVSTVELFTGERSVANLRLYHRLGYRETRRRDVGTYQLVHLTKTLSATEPAGAEAPQQRRSVQNSIISLIIDASDVELIARFWSDLLGWEIVNRGEFGVSIGTDSSPFEIDIRYVPDGAKVVKNRVHLDIASVRSEQEVEFERLLMLGARQVDVGQGERHWYVLADPEGNEFCLCRRPPRATR